MSFKSRIFAKSFGTRVGWVQLAFLFIVAVVLLRAIHLQVIQKNKLETLAARQYNQTKTVKLQRGPIVDSEGEILTVSLPMDSYFVIPGDVSDPENTADLLSGYLSFSRDDIYKKLTAKSSFVWLQRNLKPQQSEEIKRLELPGINHLIEYQRFYPLGNHAAQLIGFSGIDSQGLEGLEFQYDKHLMSDTSRQSVIKALYKAPRVDNLVGGSLKLTINSKLQYYAEKELEKAIWMMNAKHAMSIIMESQTGRVLSMATLPDYDPNNFSAFDRTTFYNRAVSAVYEPGSTFKIITVSAALENEIIQNDNFFYCEEGEYQIQDRVIHDVSRFGWLSLQQIIQKSSNICAAKIGQLVPRPLFYKTIREFGFGSKTGIDLPGEASGVVHGYANWSETDVATMSFGHSISATPIQVISALNAIATGGILIPPVVVEEARDPNGRLVELDNAQTKRILKEDVAKIVKDMMVSVTQKGGTGYQARIPGISVAGKSGTSRKFDQRRKEYSSTNHLLTFVGFFPAEQPKFTILVMIDEPQAKYNGIKSAAPVFRKIADHVLRLYSLDPVDENSSVTLLLKNDTAETSLFTEPNVILDEEVDYSKNLYKLFRNKTLREALLIAERTNYILDFEGTGVVKAVKLNAIQKNRLHLTLK